ncbi:DEAD/DEAH box helicase [Methanobrevibacter sp. DSM 116169]|uniref:DEAD/DEAH box helicase n=1 Tax=Methanobrevibacter sp. DSM 116169 TaxID=3242727 RepID=UPI0038FC921A
MSDTTFNDFNISNDIKDAIKDMGFEKPTSIQKMAIPEALEGKDVIGQAQTGTGKTVAFSVPLLEKIFIKDKSPQAIILCPTRELSIQVAGEIEKLSKNMKKLRVLAVYGGQPIGRQIRALKKGVHIIVGTPGRVLDHIDRKTLDLTGIETVVLDEADEMLDMGFREDIEHILRFTPKNRQTLLFSATIPKPIKKITKHYQKDPVHLKIAKKDMVVPQIEQYYFETKDKDKLDVLCRLIDLHDVKLGLVFSNTKRRVDFLVRNLKKRGYSADGIHGDMTQNQRDKVMGKFRNEKINILVATDVAARGIDVPDVEVVFNYDVPNHNDYYVHRIGRTGRAGKTGYAFTLASGRERKILKTIEKHTNTKIKKQKVPTFKEMEKIKDGILLDEIKESVNNDNLKKELFLVESLIEDDCNPIFVAAALLKKIKS